MIIYTNCAFFRPGLQIERTSLYGDFTIENTAFPIYLVNTEEHNIHLCVKLLQIVNFYLYWFRIAKYGQFDFLCTLL